MSEFQPFFKNGQTFLLSKKDNKNLLEKMSKVTDEENIIMQQNKNIYTSKKIHSNEKLLHAIHSVFHKNNIRFQPQVSKMQLIEPQMVFF